MKVIVIYELAGVDTRLHHRLAITLPSKWLDQSVDKVRDAFVGAYNKKFPDNALDPSELALSVKDSSPFARRLAASAATHGPAPVPVVATGRLVDAVLAC